MEINTIQDVIEAVKAAHRNGMAVVKPADHLELLVVEYFGQNKLVSEYIGNGYYSVRPELIGGNE